MASAVLHIKDAYYFEVPKVLWPSQRETLTDFPDVWVRLDEDFQEWEAKRLHESLTGLIAETPPWPELKQEYVQWQHEHANFGKPLDAMLEEDWQQARQRYDSLLQADPANAEMGFSEFLGQEETSCVWFSRQMVKKDFRQGWEDAKTKAGDTTAYAGHWSPEKIAGYNKHLSGKILIPQPLGELRNLYEPESGFCLSKFMVIEVAVALFLLAIFSWLGKKASTGGPPRGRLWNLLEVFLIYLRDNVARPAIGVRDGDRFVPLLWTIFMFVLCCNLCGMLPWVGAPTGSFSVTTGLALVTFATGIVCGMSRFGPLGYIRNQVPSMDLPLVLAIFIKPMLLAIELLGLCIKHLVLAIRLLANMVAGHLVLLGIMGLAFGGTAAVSFADAPDWLWWGTAAISVVSATLFSCLELFVAFLQAYIFTFLSALFIGASIHHH